MYCVVDFVVGLILVVRFWCLLWRLLAGLNVIAAGCLLWGFCGLVGWCFRLLCLDFISGLWISVHFMI